MAASLFNPANAFTGLRIALVPLFVGLMLYEYYLAAVGVYIFVTLSDWVDGWLARRFAWETSLGAILDPTADKMVVLSASLLLAGFKVIPAWMAIITAAREVLVLCGIVLLASHAEKNSIKKAIHSSFFGKACSGLVMTGFGLVLGRMANLVPPTWDIALMSVLGAALILNFISGLDYAAQGYRDFVDFKSHEKP